jgi:hypothetical protein
MLWASGAQALVPEVSPSSKDHRQAMFVGGGDHFRILH